MKVELQQTVPAPVEHIINWSAVGTAIGVVAGWLPAVAALFSIIWLGLQIWLFIFVKRPWRRE